MRKEQPEERVRITPEAVAANPDILKKKPGTFAKGNRISVGNKGNCGTPRFITQQLISQLKEIVSNPDPKTDADKRKRASTVYWIVKKMINLALEGDTTCLKMIMDRVEGTPTQTVAIVETTPEIEAQKLDSVRDQLKQMPDDERVRIYQQAILETQRTDGSA